MQGHKQFPDQVVTQFCLSKRVPHHNLYRRLGELLDWEFLRAQPGGRATGSGDTQSV